MNYKPFRVLGEAICAGCRTPEPATIQLLTDPWGHPYLELATLPPGWKRCGDAKHPYCVTCSLVCK